MLPAIHRIRSNAACTPQESKARRFDAAHCSSDPCSSRCSRAMCDLCFPFLNSTLLKIGSRPRAALSLTSIWRDTIDLVVNASGICGSVPSLRATRGGRDVDVGPRNLGGVCSCGAAPAKSLDRFSLTGNPHLKREERVSPLL